MKLKETLSNTEIENLDIESIGEDHVATSSETPMRPDAFELDDNLKIELIAKHFKEIMHVLGLDLTDDSLKGTPYRGCQDVCQRGF